MNPQPSPEAIRSLLRKAQLGSDFTILPIAGGGNNRSYKLDCSEGTFFLKDYFFSESDVRDRLGTEFAFSSYAWDLGIRCIPQPIAFDAEHRLGLFSFVDGRRITEAELTPTHVEAAASFFRALNPAGRREALANAVPPASESAFSMAQHLQLISARVERLRQIKPVTETDREACLFVESYLVSQWEAVRTKTLRGNVTLMAQLGRSAQSISPSDFGFHNALVNHDGSVFFVDFEYAGWDDPARTAVEFFLQPQVPVSREYWGIIAAATLPHGFSSELHQMRMEALAPIYRIKWCCILLNTFLPVGHSRRAFALSELEVESRKARQLRAAEALLRGAGLLQ